jgi:diguanylate cyclase (GGDEF)-like protein
MHSMNFYRLTHSIVTRIILLGVVIVLFGAVVRYVLLSQYLREDLGRIVATQQVALAEYVAADLEAKLLSRRTMLGQMAATLPMDLLKRPKELRQWLGDRFALQPLFSEGMFVTDIQGLPLADFPQRPGRIGVTYADRDYIQSALQGKQMFGKPVVGRVAKEPILPLASPIKDASGAVVAVLVGITGLDEPGFLTLPKPNALGEGSSFLLISPQDRFFIAASEEDWALKPTPPEGVNLLHDRAMAGYRGSGVTVSAEGREEIAGIASVPSTGWFVVSRLPTAQALASVSRAQSYVAKNSVVVLLAFLLLSTAFFWHVFRPLLHAADRADRMTKGELPLEPLPVHRDDEVGHLTQAFNRLLGKLQMHQSQLELAAHHDPLTGLPNRILLADRLTQTLARAHRNGLSLAVLYLDLDGFKPINDTLGHNIGDLALSEVARRLASTVRESDTLARIGGDEFMIVMGELEADSLSAELSAQAVAEKCLEVFATPFTLDGVERSLGVSIGVSVGDGACSPDDLRKSADEAMYQAKHAGGQRLVVVQCPMSMASV